MAQTGDPAMDIPERLETLEKTVENVRAKNEELENKYLELQQMIQTSRGNDIINSEVDGDETNGDAVDGDEADGSTLMTPNAYTFLYTSELFSGPSIAGMVTCSIQYTVFSLFLLDLLNTESVPPGVAALVRVVQVIAIIIAFLVETDTLTALRAVIYRNGFDEMANSFNGFTPWKYDVANFLLGGQGLLGKVVAFYLIIFADNVFDLLLNFTAVMFISELNEIVCFLATDGYVGKEAETLGKKIEEMQFPRRPPKGIMRHVHVLIHGLIMVGAFVAFSFVAFEQASQESLAEFVKVQFGDDVDPTLGLFSGCYEKNITFTFGGWDSWDSRVQYVRTQPDRGDGKFDYCLDDGLQTWVFATDQSKTSCDENVALRSAEERSTSFDLLDAKGDQWLLETGNTISEFQLNEIDPDRVEIECGNISLEGEDVCLVLTVDADAVGFSGSHAWSRTFVMLQNSKAEAVQFYQHPVFIGDAAGTEGYELLFFTGRRWVLASASKLLTEDSNREDVIALFETSNFWLLKLPTDALSYLSEAVNQGSDRGTPLGLQWYDARYADEISFPFADTGRPVDASFRCGKCNNRTNPCLHEGICQDDGSCTCSHGALGSLCEIKPLGDGQCNPFFNTAPDRYDGGDCCVATCSKANCGVGGMDFAFDQSLSRNGTGFPYCKDPLMVPITIILETEIESLNTGTSFESYTVEVVCEKAPLRVALDPSIVGTLNETLYVEDKEGSCLLSFIGIQSWSGLNISYQILDGLDSSADSVVLLHEETTIAADGVFAWPALYSQCLKETLAGTIDPRHLYTGSYQDQAFARLSNELPKNANCSSDEEYWIERYALVALSTAEEAPDNWIRSSDHCLWPRVTCDGSRVVEFTYDGYTKGALKGSLAPEFTLLRHLERLDVFGNEFSQSSVPSEIGTMSALKTFILSDSALSGALPSEVGNLSSLEFLELALNALSGSIPSEVGKLSALTDLWLYHNALSGALPSEVGNLNALAQMWLYNNALSGTIPSEVGNLGVMTEWFLQNNALSGAVPSEVGNLSALVSVFLNNNTLSGSLPSEMGNLSALTRLWLYDNALSGNIPSEVGNMSALTALHLHNNALSGIIPSQVGNLTSLQALILYDNALSGSLPSEIGLLDDLLYLNLRGNVLSETLPSEIGLLTNLQFLILDGNRLSGPLPTEILQLTRLRQLEVSGNLFSEEEVNNTTLALGLSFSCNDGETIMEIVVTTDNWPSETSWKIDAADGTPIASVRGYTLESISHFKKVCIPLDACKFTMIDRYSDGGPSVEITRLGKVYEIDGGGFTDKVVVDICI